MASNRFILKEDENKFLLRPDPNRFVLTEIAFAPPLGSSVTCDSIVITCDSILITCDAI